MGRVLVVAGAVGGAGASTLAALLARRRSGRGRRAALVDLDPGGAGTDVLLGLEETAGARWADLRHARGTLAPGDLRDVLPRWCGVDVLSTDARGPGTPDPDVLAAVLGALAADAGTVVVDLPARSGAAEAAWPVLREVADALLVVASQDVLGVAGAVAARRRLDGVPTQLLVRRRARAGVAPAEVGHALGAPVTVVPADRSVASSTDHGLGPRPGGRLRRAVARVERACPA